MMKPPLDYKAPDEQKDYSIDWTAAIADAALTITSSAWEIVSALGSPDLTIDTHDIDGQYTVVRLSGGEPGNDYTLVNTVVLSNGEHLVDAIEVRVRTAAEKAGIY